MLCHRVDDSVSSHIDAYFLIEKPRLGTQTYSNIFINQAQQNNLQTYKIFYHPKDEEKLHILLQKIIDNIKYTRNTNINGEKLQDKATKSLETVFRKENNVLIAYLFGSYARGVQTTKSDVDVAILLSETPPKMLEYFLHLGNELSSASNNEVDLIILNTAPPLLKHQIIKHGKILYCKDEKTRIEFEAKAQDEYLDLSIAIARYDKCLIKEILA